MSYVIQIQSKETVGVFTGEDYDLRGPDVRMLDVYRYPPKGSEVPEHTEVPLLAGDKVRIMTPYGELIVEVEIK